MEGVLLDDFFEEEFAARAGFAHYKSKLKSSLTDYPFKLPTI